MLIKTNFVLYFEETMVKRNTKKKNNTKTSEIKNPIFSTFRGYVFKTFLKKRILSKAVIKNDTNKISVI